MKFVLIFWLLAGGATNLSTSGTATFDDEKACNAALDQLAQTWAPVDPFVSGIIMQQDVAKPRKPGICVPQASAPEAPTPTVVTTRPAVPGIPATKGTR